MAEEEDKIGKCRLRMERDIYSVLLSFKDGATPMQLEKRMDETLGYTYNGKYYQGGVHDMAQLLREHPKVRQGVDGKFKIVPTEEVADLVALIAKQRMESKPRAFNPAAASFVPQPPPGFPSMPFDVRPRWNEYMNVARTRKRGRRQESARQERKRFSKAEKDAVLKELIDEKRRKEEERNEILDEIIQEKKKEKAHARIVDSDEDESENDDARALRKKIRGIEKKEMKLKEEKERLKERLECVEKKAKEAKKRPKMDKKQLMKKLLQMLDSDDDEEDEEEEGQNEGGGGKKGEN